MAYNRYLGGFGQPGALPVPGGVTDMGPGRGLAPPVGPPMPYQDQFGNYPGAGRGVSVSRYLGGFGRPGGGYGTPGGPPGNPVPQPGTRNSLGPPTPRLGQGSRYLGGFSKPGASRLPPRQGDGPPSVTDWNAQPTVSWMGQMANLRPPGGLGPPISPVTGGGTRPGVPPPSPLTGPGSPGWQPSEHGAGRWVGAPQVPGEAAGRYLGPPMRMTVPIDPRTGKRAVGAAAIWASLTAAGSPLVKPGAGLTFEQADKMRADAIAAIQGTPMDPFADPEWEAWLRSGAPLENGAVPNFLRGPDNGPFQNTFDYEGNELPPGAEGGGFLPGGYDPSWPWGPDVGETATQADEDAYMNWLRANGLLGWNE